MQDFGWCYFQFLILKFVNIAEANFSGSRHHISGM